LRWEGHANAWQFSVPVYLDDLQADFVAVELYAMPRGDQAAQCFPMQRGEPLAGAVNAFSYSVSVPGSRAPGDYTPRIVPALEGARVPIESSRILWYR